MPIVTLDAQVLTVSFLPPSVLLCLAKLTEPTCHISPIFVGTHHHRTSPAQISGVGTVNEVPAGNCFGVWV